MVEKKYDSNTEARHMQMVFILYSVNETACVNAFTASDANYRNEEEGGDERILAFHRHRNMRRQRQPINLQLNFVLMKSK